jgi:hypothetical protein
VIVGVSYKLNDMVFASNKFYKCIQANVSTTANAPTGVDGALYWVEVTLETVQASGIYGVGLQVIGTNTNVIEKLVKALQASAGEPIVVTVSKNLLKGLSQVSGSLIFSDEGNWKLVSCIFKHTSSAKRLTSGSRDISVSKDMPVKSGMSSGEEYQLVKLIVSTPERGLLVIKRAELSSPTDFDFTLK